MVYEPFAHDARLARAAVSAISAVRDIKWRASDIEPAANDVGCVDFFDATEQSVWFDQHGITKESRVLVVCNPPFSQIDEAMKGVFNNVPGVCAVAAIVDDSKGRQLFANPPQGFTLVAMKQYPHISFAKPQGAPDPDKAREVTVRLCIFERCGNDPSIQEDYTVQSSDDVFELTAVQASKIDALSGKCDCVVQIGNRNPPPNPSNPFSPPKSNHSSSPNPIHPILQIQSNPSFPPSPIQSILPSKSNPSSPPNPINSLL
jgi:hypothetical protein